MPRHVQLIVWLPVVLAWPTRFKPPPPPVSDSLPPPPSPPPVSALDGSQPLLNLKWLDAGRLGRSMLVAQEQPFQTLRVLGLVSGLAPTADFAVGVVVGTGCNKQARGHASFSSNGQGVANIDLKVPIMLTPSNHYTLLQIRTLDGDLVACAAVEPANNDPGGARTQLAIVGDIPAYQGHIDVRGLVRLTRQRTASGSEQIHIAGVITGLEPSASGMWHIHQGFNCEGADVRTNDVCHAHPLCARMHDVARCKQPLVCLTSRPIQLSDPPDCLTVWASVSVSVAGGPCVARTVQWPRLGLLHGAIAAARLRPVDYLHLPLRSSRRRSDQRA